MLARVKKRWPGKSKKKPEKEPDENDGDSNLDQSPVAPRTATSEFDPWERAYQIMLDQQPELMASYAEHLSHSQGGTASSVDLSTVRSVESTVDQLLKDREDKQWRVSLLGKDIKIREHAENLVKFLLWTDPIIKGMLSAQPYAQLAWSGVSLLLPLLRSGTTQIEAMLKGFVSISNIQLYWQIYEEKCPRLEYQQEYRRLIEPLAKLYSQIIEYQAYTICHLSRTQLSRARVDVFGPNDWDSMAQKIEKSSQECSKFIQLFNEGEVRDYWTKQLQKMQESQGILDEIRRILEEGGMQTLKIYEDETEKELLRDLASTYKSDKEDVPAKEKDTCEWVFNDGKFRKWRDSDTPCLLWVTAGPGCGKSVLSRALIDEGRLSTNITTSIICYFFFKDGDERRRHSTDALCAILHQIFTQDSSGSLIRKALPSHKKSGKFLTQDFSELWRILIECCESSNAVEVVCVLDALDECDEKGRQRLMDKLTGFFSKPDLSEYPTKVKFLITSRSYPDLEASFGKVSNISAYWRLDGDSDNKSEEIGKEINLVIDARLRDITRGFEGKDRDEISRRLKLMKNRTYLWLYLTFDAIERSGSKRRADVESSLAELSEEVTDKYEKILGRSKNQHQTKLLLQILLATAQPLTVDEANIALTLALRDKQATSYMELQSELWPRENFGDVVKELCGLFVNIHDGRLSFIHQTARDFLLDSQQSGNWKGRFKMPEAHGAILRSCLYYLIMSGLPDIPFRQPNKAILDVDSDQHEFLHYAALQWSWHFSQRSREGGAGSEKEMLELALRLCDPSTTHYRVWSSLYARKNWGFPRSPSCLIIAAYLGHEAVVQHLLKTPNLDINSPDDRGRTALLYAAKQGQTAIVKLLLDTGQADVNSKDINNSTPLSYAARKGQNAVVKLLLHTGRADVDLKDLCDTSPLSHAAENGHEAIVKLLLDTGQADVNSKDEQGYTPLSYAAENGHEAVVKLLLDTGQVDVNSKDEQSCTPLSRAVENGQEAIVRLLLDTGQADVDWEDGLGWTPLSYAIMNGHEAVVRLLLDTGQADVNREGSLGWTPLSCAVANENEAIVELLESYGASQRVSESPV